MRKKIRELKKIIEQNISRFVTIKLISFLLNNIFIVFNERQMNWIVKIIVKHVTIKTLTLINFDVSIRVHINRKYVKQHKLFIVEFTKFIKLKLINEFFVKNITHATKIDLMIDDYYKQLWIFVIDCENFDIILKQSWLLNHNSHIDWKNRIMTFNFKHCCVNCNSIFEIITIINRNFKFKNKHRKNKFFKKNAFVTNSILRIF